MDSNIKKPDFAGSFYPNSINQIESLLGKILQGEKNKIDYNLSEKSIIGGIVPHAGYVYSAYQAVHFFEIIKNSKTKFDTVVIVNPSHSGTGPEISIDNHEFWETPLGQIRHDLEFADLIDFDISSIAQNNEHSGEVMIPYLQYFLNYEFEILPICFNYQNLENARKIAREIYFVNRQLKKNIIVIASSDFSHFQSPEQGRALDKLVLDKILSFDSEGVQQVVKVNNISVCGFGPIMALMEYSKLISNHPETSILKAGHSGEIRPSSRVVDYVSMLFYE